MPRFSPGEAVRYRMNVSLLIESSLGPLDDPVASRQSLRGAVDLTWRIEFISQEADGSTRLRAVVEALELEPPEWGERSRPADFIGQSISYRLRPDGRVDDLQLPDSWSKNGDAPPWLGPWLDFGAGSQLGLPERPLLPGDRWESSRAREVPGLPRQRETSASEYLRDEFRGQVPCAAILTRFAGAGSDAREVDEPGGGRTRTERRFEAEGDRLACHDLATGRVLDSTLRSHELLRLRVLDISQDRSEPGTPLVLETRTVLESHLRVVD